MTTGDSFYEITTDFSEDFYSGIGPGATTLVPFIYDVAVGGRPFIVDTKYMDRFVEASIQTLRPQSDDSNEPGEQSVNPEDFWRRSQHTWNHGAGQNYLDRGTTESGVPSDRAEFRRSKGINPWDIDMIQLLHDTEKKYSTAQTNLYLMPANDRVYLTDGNSVKFTTAPLLPTWATTPVTGTPAVPVKGIASNGYNVYIAYGASGLYRTDVTVSAATQLVNVPVDGPIGWLKGRLMAAHQNSLFNITDLVGPSALPLANFTHPNTDFRWVGYAEGLSAIYAGGFSGDKSQIFKITIRSDGSGLVTAIPAGELPDGEILYGLGGYLGYIMLGTSKGARFCQATDDGNLVIGDIVDTGGSPVRTFEGQEQFIWFGWTNYDSTSTGLGRMNLRVLTDPNAIKLAYATDLMANDQGNVLSVINFGNKRYFSVAGKGFYGEIDNLCPSGYLDTGWMTYGLPDDKIGMYVDVRYAVPVLGGTARTYVAVDGTETYTLVGYHDKDSFPQTGSTFPLGELKAEKFEIREELIRDGTDLTLGPKVISHTVKAHPATVGRERISIPLLVFDEENIDGSDQYRDPRADVEFFKGLRRDQSVTTLQIGETSYSVVIEDYQIVYDRRSQSRRFWSCTILAVCKTV